MLEERLRKVFREIFSQPRLEISDDMSAEDISDWDSLKHIQLIVAVEKEFGFKFKNSEIARLKNIGDLKALVGKYA